MIGLDAECSTSFQSFWPGSGGYGDENTRLFKPFEKGDRVKLTIKNYYRDDSYNPLWGGKYGHVTGTVGHGGGNYTNESACYLDVKWDNGTANTYRHVDLQSVSPWEEFKDEHLEDELFEI